MTYFKIVSSDGTATAVMAYENPPYVKYQTRNKMLLRCSEREAEGIIGTDNNTIYPLDGKELNGVENTDNLNAVTITTAEYEELVGTLDTTDGEDSDPDTETDSDGNTTEILSRKELTEKVASLESNIEFLSDCLTKNVRGSLCLGILYTYF